jgi:hypothetical protein
MAYNTMPRPEYFDKFQQDYFNSKLNQKTCAFNDSTVGQISKSLCWFDYIRGTWS